MWLEYIYRDLSSIILVDLRSVSMGQGQEYHARKMIMESMANGGWVLLQNVHLSLPFCSEVIDMLVETEHIDNTFRMWVTTEPHSEFPIGLLQMAIKFTNEPPQGIRASLKRSYQVRALPRMGYPFYNSLPPSPCSPSRRTSWTTPRPRSGHRCCIPLPSCTPLCRNVASSVHSAGIYPTNSIKPTSPLAYSSYRIIWMKWIPRRVSPGRH